MEHPFLSDHIRYPVVETAVIRMRICFVHAATEKKLN